MDRYSAVTEYLLDARIEREPSWELIVFCLVTGMIEVPDEFDVLDAEFAMTSVHCGVLMCC